MTIALLTSASGRASLVWISAGSGTTEGQPPRSYDFRYLGDETPKPTTEAEKAEFRTTLLNWGIFALALVLVMIIVAIIL